MLLATNMGMGEGIFFTILCVIIVFVVIGGIIFGAYFLSKLMDGSKKETKKVENLSSPVINRPRNTNIEDDDMMAAVLVATIDFRNEIKEDVRLVSVNKIK